jgi:hypothetical protein
VALGGPGRNRGPIQINIVASYYYVVQLMVNRFLQPLGMLCRTASVFRALSIECECILLTVLL